jgi:multisubunit Na+/H+ antiporter MnhB subunit
VPLLVLCVGLRLLNPGLAFLGMLLGIFAFVATMLAMVHTLATRSAGDYRAGVAATAIIFAWVLAFWFPMTW